jgi:type I restriction enzyme S subunit
MATFPIAKLSDCVELLAGFAFKSQHFTDRPDDIPLVKGENVSQGCILWDISKRWSAADWTNFKKYQLMPGDVVVAMDRPWVPAGLKWAYIRKNDPKALLVQRCSRLRSCTPKLDQDFLRFVIGGPGFESYVRPITTGVNVPHISGKQILDYDFPLPPLPIQRRIAGILSAHDELIENSQRRIKILESMARGLYREWFIHFRFPGHESVPRVPSPMGEIPKGWEGAFGDISTIDRVGINPFDFPNEEFEHYSIPAFDDGCSAAIETGETIRSNKYCIDKDCVLLSKLNPRIPRVWLPSPTESRRSITSTEFLVLRPKSGVSREFIYGKCCSDDFAAQFAGLAIGTSTSHQRVRPENVLAMPSTVPTHAVIEQFTTRTAPMLAASDQLRLKIQNLRRTRDLLLPRLLSGQIDVEAMAS